MDMVKVKINGIDVEVPKGSTILEAARYLGIEIPTLCYMKEINEIGACRICVVEVKGMKNLVASCVYPVSEGMEISTTSPRVFESRRHTLELLLSNHDKKCLTCARSNNCELQKLCKDFKVEDEDFFAGERTPINDPLACGCLLGLTLAHTRAHLYRSALESVAYSVNQQIRIMEAHDNVDIDQIFAVGGGVQNPHWMQIVADVTGKEINTPLVTIGASFGDAMMAATAVKYPGFEDFAALTKFIKPGCTFYPNPEAHEQYKAFQEVYDKLYPATVELMHALAKQ